MFVERDKWEEGVLRQGDILANIPFPFLQYSRLKALSALSPEHHSQFPLAPIDTHALRDPGDQNYFTAHLPCRLSFCVVASQCCELTTNTSGRLRTAAITVCRLVPLTRTMLDDEEKLTSLKSNRDPRKEAKSYKNYFYVGNGPADGERGPVLGDKELMADFSQLASIPASEYPTITQSKILQMTDRERMKFKIKLGVFMAKPTEEENAAGIAMDPWATGDVQT